MVDHNTYLYGPVLSRRLGLSLGVDVVPFKVCTLDCLYCQLGPTSRKTLKRSTYVPAEAVLAELKQKLTRPGTVDFITIGGSGEPTLNANLGQLLAAIKKITSLPVAILTNGTLLHRQDVQLDCASADVVLPSLDAGDQETFQSINRPHKDISIEKLVDGLCAFREMFAGRIWLEVFLIDGLNTAPHQLANIKAAADRIRPDKIQLNTAVRPATDPDLKRVSDEKLQAIAATWGPPAEVVAGSLPHTASKHPGPQSKDVLSVLKRRPCSIQDICSALGVHSNEALKLIAVLQQQGLVESAEKDAVTFFRAT